MVLSAQDMNDDKRYIISDDKQKVSYTEIIMRYITNIHAIVVSCLFL